MYAVMPCCMLSYIIATMCLNLLIKPYLALNIDLLFAHIRKHNKIP